MIFIGDERYYRQSSSYMLEKEMIETLMENGTLCSAATLFKSTGEKRICGTSMDVKYVYVFQKEYATVDPASVDFVGTDEATTCVGVALRNRTNGMISIAHMDFADVVDNGLNQMLSQLSGCNSNEEMELDVHLIGGFDDALPKHEIGVHRNEIRKAQGGGYSRPLCLKILEALERRPEPFYIQTLFVLGHNTRMDPVGAAMPIFHGFVVETSSGAIIPARFETSARGPDEVVRRIRICAAHDDPMWKDKLLDTYNTHNDEFNIAPCSWSYDLLQTAMVLQNLSDSEFLHLCSTSPSAEGPDFVDNGRRTWNYLMEHPNWLDTFQRNRPRVFKRSNNRDWMIS